MESNDIKAYVAQTGYRTLAELKVHFITEDQEILESTLSYLTSKNSLRKVRYTGPSGVSDLYCIPA